MPDNSIPPSSNRPGPGDLSGASAPKVANMALSFLLELCLLAALGYWGFKTQTGWLARTLFGVGLPLAAAALWGVLLAPASKRRLPLLPRLGLKIMLFGLGAAALYNAGQPGPALVFGALAAVNMLLALAWRQEHV